MYEEYALDAIFQTVLGYLTFKYSKVFLQRKFDDRAKALILWIFLYASVKMIYGNFTQSFHIFLHFSLIMALQILFFDKNLLRQIFSAISFVAALEILRFTASPLAHALFDLWNPFWAWLVNFLLIKEIFSAETLMNLMSVSNRIALFCTLALCRALQLVILYAYLKVISKNFVNIEYELTKREALFLITPCVAVLLTDFTLRLMAYSVDNGALMLIYDRAPEIVVMLPLVSLASLGFILSSVILFRGLADGKEEERKRLLLENSVLKIHSQIRELNDIYNDTRGLKHDLRGHIAGVAAYIRNRFKENPPELSAYLKGMENAASKLDFADKTGNSLTDVILHQFRQQCKRKNIEVYFDFHYPTKNEFDVYDIGIILNNALQNAVEASEKVLKSPSVSLC